MLCHPQALAQLRALRDNALGQRSLSDATPRHDARRPRETREEAPRAAEAEPRAAAEPAPAAAAEVKAAELPAAAEPAAAPTAAEVMAPLKAAAQALLSAGALAAAAEPSVVQPIASDRPPKLPDWEPLSAAAAAALSPPKIGVVVIAYNRPEYLDRSLRSIVAAHPASSGTKPHPTPTRLGLQLSTYPIINILDIPAGTDKSAPFPLHVSLDGQNQRVEEVARRHGAAVLIHPRRRIFFPKV